MRTVKLFLHLLALIILTSCNSNLDKRLPLVDIDEKWRNGNLTEAKTEINDYLKNNPDNELAWALLGHIESSRKEYSAAISAYNKSLSLNPKTVEAITGMGIVHRRMGDYDKASDYYHKAIDINPEYAEAYSSLVLVNLKRKKFKQAVAMGLKGYELDKTNDIIAANLSIAYHFVNDTIQREKYFNIAKKNGYKNMKTLRAIFDGKLTIFN